MHETVTTATLTNPHCDTVYQGGLYLISGIMECGLIFITCVLTFFVYGYVKGKIYFLKEAWEKDGGFFEHIYDEI